jgi:hypothetical protein
VGREATAEKLIDYDGDTLKLHLCSAAYLALAWDDDDGFIGIAHTMTDVTPYILDTVTLANVDVTASAYAGGAGWVQSDPAVFTGLAVGETAMCAVLEDDTTNHVIGFYDHLAGSEPMEIIGTGTNKTIAMPTNGWLRI